MNVTRKIILWPDKFWVFADDVEDIDFYINSTGLSDDYEIINVVMPDDANDNWIDERLDQLQDAYRNSKTYSWEKYLNSIKNAVESATLENLLSIADKTPQTRMQDEIQKHLPKGYSFYIDDIGVGRLICPLYVSYTHR